MRQSDTRAEAGRLLRDFGMAFAAVVVVLALIGAETNGGTASADMLAVAEAYAQPLNPGDPAQVGLNRTAALLLSAGLFSSIVAFNLWFYRRLVQAHASARRQRRLPR